MITDSNFGFKEGLTVNGGGVVDAVFLLLVLGLCPGMLLQGHGIKYQVSPFRSFVV